MSPPIHHVFLPSQERQDLPVQLKLYRSQKLWSFYCDLEESLGTVESTKAVYNKMLDLKIATPQIILNYATFLQVGGAPVWATLFLCRLFGPFSASHFSNACVMLVCFLGCRGGH